MWHKPKINSYDGTDFLPYHTSYSYFTDKFMSDYKSKDFLKDLTREKEHRLIRFLNVFLYGTMMIVDWLGEKLKHEKKKRNSRNSDM